MNYDERDYIDDEWNPEYQALDRERCDILATICALDALRRDKPARELSIAITKLQEAAMWIKNLQEQPNGTA